MSFGRSHREFHTPTALIDVFPTRWRRLCLHHQYALILSLGRSFHIVRWNSSEWSARNCYFGWIHFQGFEILENRERCECEDSLFINLLHQSLAPIVSNWRFKIQVLLEQHRSEYSDPGTRSRNMRGMIVAGMFTGTLIRSKRSSSASIFSNG